VDIFARSEKRREEGATPASVCDDLSRSTEKRRNALDAGQPSAARIRQSAGCQQGTRSASQKQQPAAASEPPPSRALKPANRGGLPDRNFPVSSVSANDQNCDKVICAARAMRAGAAFDHEHEHRRCATEHEQDGLACRHRRQPGDNAYSATGASHQPAAFGGCRRVVLRLRLLKFSPIGAAAAEREDACATLVELVFNCEMYTLRCMIAASIACGWSPTPSD